MITEPIMGANMRSGSTARAAVPEPVFPCPGPLPERRVHVVGTVFFDIVYSGLRGRPQPGTEVQATHLGISPGGAANMAVALARLGLDVGLSALFAEDSFGQYLWSALAYEGIDLSLSSQLPEWTTPVTTSVAYGPERTMVTYEAPPPVDVVDLVPDGYRADAFVMSLAGLDSRWLARLHEHTPLVVADVGWDVEYLGSRELADKLRYVDVFMPNAAEARVSSGRDDVEDAARALSGERRLVVVKDSGSGSVAIDPATGSVLRVPALPVQARDTTGAGDVFDAGFVYGSLARWPLPQRMRFANLCAAESVKLEGGSLSAPCWRDLKAFWDSLADPVLREAYNFLPALFDGQPARHPCTRACPTLSALPALSEAARAASGPLAGQVPGAGGWRPRGT